jgi:uncharacterized ferritin-like protein (DUF455 family)
MIVNRARLRQSQPSYIRPMSLRHNALRVLVESDPDEKSRLARALDTDGPTGADEPIAQPAGIPGRPAKPELVAHTQLKSRSLKTIDGRAALLHALAHIELNAIDLAVDVVWRFAGMPDLFYRQWAMVAREEALHFQLLRDHLRSMGFDYGSFPAHNALWEMAEKTQDDLVARIALVPRTLEARGLDASPPIKAKLVAAGDLKAGNILDVILRDEIGHVAVGNHWYRLLCEQRGLDPLATYRELAERYGAPRPRGPFNLEARRAAGFGEDELAALMR